METKSIKSDLLLLLAAAIWGFAFVAQIVGMEYVGPFTFNGVRFGLGCLSLLPLILYNRKNGQKKYETPGNKHVLKAGIIAGLFLFSAVSLQQVGMQDTTAGKAGFITGLYIVIVPILGVFLKQRIKAATWISAIIAVTGLYFLTVTNGFTISRGDLTVLIGAFFWAFHILIIDYFSNKVNALKLSFFQFLTCSILSTCTAIFIEKIELHSLLQAAVPILYGGIFSVGVAYTLQIIGQKNAAPSHAALILSMETVFAAVGGFLILNERLNINGIVGCLMILSAILLSQVQSIKGQGKAADA